MRFSGSRDAQRRKGMLYVVFLAATLPGTFAVVWSEQVRILPVRLMHVPVLAYLVIAATGLLWLRPHGAWYSAGLACTVAALASFWIASPIGGSWIARVTQDPAFNGGIFNVVAMPLFALAWLLLGRSVTSWRWAAVTYLAEGIVFVLLGVVATASPAQTAANWLLLGAGIFIWPYYTLLLLGVFGWTLR